MATVKWGDINQQTELGVPCKKKMTTLVTLVSFWGAVHMGLLNRKLMINQWVLG